jgi:RNA polymerase sigma-70 factor, ECF subfamily
LFIKYKVKKAKNGDHKAFQELIEHEKIKLYRIAYLYTRNENDALDIFQETIFKALNSIHTLKNEEYFSTWITRILINNAKTLLTKRNHTIPLENDFFNTIQPSPQLLIEDKMDLLQAMGQLEEKEKTALILRYYKDYTINQISDILDIPEGTVKSMIHRALKKLKGNMQGGFVNG